MNQKTLTLILAAAILAGGVALGIHILNKEIIAEVTYRVYVWEDCGGVPTPVTDAWIQFRFNGGNWEEVDGEGEGWYWITIAEGANSWSIRFVDQTYLPNT